MTQPQPGGIGNGMACLRQGGAAGVGAAEQRTGRLDRIARRTGTEPRRDAQGGTERPSKRNQAAMMNIDIKATLKKGSSANGAWNRAQLALLGVPWPPSKGWNAEQIRDCFQLSLDAHGRFVRLRTPS